MYLSNTNASLHQVEFFFRHRPPDCFTQYPAKVGPDLCRIFLAIFWVPYYSSDDGLAHQIAQLVYGQVGKRRAIQPKSRNWRDAQWTLAVVERQLGNVAQALELLQPIVDFDARNLADDDPSRLSAQRTLASVLSQLGQYAEARKLLEHGVRILRRTLPPTDPHLWHSEHDLAIAYLNVDKPRSALKLLKRGVKVRQGLGLQPTSVAQSRTKPRIHRDVQLAMPGGNLFSERWMAVAYMENGNMSQALRVLKLLLRTLCKTRSRAHPEVLSSLHELGRCYLETSNLVKSLSLFKHVVKLRRVRLHHKHSERLISEHMLAVAYQRLGRYHKALPIIKEVVRDRKETLIPTDPFRISSERFLAKCISAVKERQQRIDQGHPTDADLADNEEPSEDEDDDASISISEGSSVEFSSNSEFELEELQEEPPSDSVSDRQGLERQNGGFKRRVWPRIKKYLREVNRRQYPRSAV